jgi:hypothetical protein
MLYEITFPDGRKELRCKIGLAEQAAITTARSSANAWWSR